MRIEVVSLVSEVSAVSIVHIGSSTCRLHRTDSPTYSDHPNLSLTLSISFPIRFYVSDDLRLRSDSVSRFPTFVTIAPVRQLYQRIASILSHSSTFPNSFYSLPTLSRSVIPAILITPPSF